jgi:ABC-type branched-subunit amino acid transport system ATPase component/predicted MFS family arabinose efflux permease
LSDEVEERSGGLAGAFLEMEDERQQSIADARDTGDDVMPGMGEGEMTLRQALNRGGMVTFTTLAAITAIDNLEVATMGTLSPDIRDSLGLSDGAIIFIISASSAFLILGALPMGWLADRYRRGRIIGFSNLFFGLMTALTGIATNGVTLFFARLGVGSTKSNTFTVQSTLIADTYPITSRGRVGSTLSLFGSVTGTLSPLIVGGVATLIGGSNGWRWVFIMLSIPICLVSILGFSLPEPPRGQFEKQDVLGEVVVEDDPLPISVEAAFARLLQIRTLKAVITAFAAIGFGLFTVPILGNLFMEDEYGLSSFGRGAVGTVSGVAVMISVPFVGKFYDGQYRKDPARALRFVGWLVLPSALLVPVQYFMPNPVLFALLAVPTAVMTVAAYSMVGPLLMSVIPYRLRGMGQALGALYIFFIGATGGALLAGLLSNAYSTRVAIIVLYVPATIVGGALMLRSASFIHDDLRLVSRELREEQDEHRRRMDNPDHVAALQVSQVDFSYGQVQILFDVGFEVRKGEVLALLGTNGAGKSTILRVIAGLGTPARGVVRHHGRTITYVTPEMRTRLGIRMLPGGKGVFNDLSIRENLEVAAYNLRKDRTAMNDAIDGALALFPELRARGDVPASSLSGGQQQMLALAQVLTTETDILIIDELSLGLAPIMVERLVKVIEQLREQGMTIIVVEQSLNVAMAIADRAVFLEKGHVRFEGDMKELAGRDDLARAVFLGKDGG